MRRCWRMIDNTASRELMYALEKEHVLIINDQGSSDVILALL